MSRVIVLDDLAREGLDVLSTEGVDYEVRTGLKGAPLREALTGFDGAICRSGVTLSADVLQGNRRLKAIVRAGVGADNIDKTAATRQGIAVMNTPAGNTLSTCEHTFALMLALSRNVVPACQSLFDGRWDRKSYMGSQLADKTLGIVGVGRIGQEVAKRALAFQMRVIGFDPFLSAERAAELGVELAENVHDMLHKVDYLSVHTPLTSETKSLIGRAEVELLKPGARLVNCARGGIFDERALVEGIKSGKLAGVALDVYEKEPCTDSPLFGLPGVLCTPHLGASTEEAQTQVAVEAANLLVRYLRTGELRHAINIASVDLATLEALRGHLNVAYRLGLLLAQWHGSGATSCRLGYRGEIATKDTKLLSAAFCCGLLERALDEQVNIINSEVLLRERGIELVEQCRSDMGAFSSSITAEVVTERKSYVAGGTLFGNDMPRIIRLGDYRLEAYLDGTLLIFTHVDVPGIIGSVGTIFAAHDVNIAQMAVGRTTDEPGGQAIGVLNLDGRPPQSAIEAVLAHSDITSAVVIEMPSAGQRPPWLQF